MIIRRGLLAAPALLALRPALAQERFPSRPLRMILPFAPGGSADRLGRGIAEFMRADLGQQVVAENRPGGAGVIGASAAMGAPRDGYTMLWSNWALITLNLVMSRNPPFRTEDWAPISSVFMVPLVFAVPPSLPVASFADLVALSRSRGGLGYGHSGVGSASQLFLERLRLTHEMAFEQVAFPGEAPAATAVLGGHVPFYVGSAATILEQVRAGRLRVIATTNAERMRVLPDVPTLVEQGYGPASAFAYWHGIVAPAGVPEAALDRLNGAVVAALGDAAVRSRMGEDMTPWPTTREGFAALIRQDIEQWTPVIRRAGLTME